MRRALALASHWLVKASAGLRELGRIETPALASGWKRIGTTHSPGVEPGSRAAAQFRWGVSPGLVGADTAEAGARIGAAEHEAMHLPLILGAPAADPVRCLAKQRQGGLSGDIEN